MKKSIFVLLILLCLFSVLSAKRIVKIGSYENPPKIYTDENGKVSGFWADITNYIAKQENWEIKWVHGSWQECLERLKNNDIDIMVDVGDTPERERKYDFSHENVLLSWTRIYRQKGSDIKSILDLKGKTIAGLKGSFDLNGPEGLKAITQKFEIPCKIIEMENYNQIFSALEKKQIDAGIVDKDFGNINEMKFHIERTPIVLQPAKMLYAFPKNAQDNKYFINRIDHHIANLKKDNKSIYYTAFDEFLGGTKKITLINPWLLWLIGFSAILIVLVTIFNISLKYQVNKKTLALKKDIIKRKQIQKKLSENEERLRTLINSTPDIICFKDGKGRWLEANTADLELFSLQNVDYKLKTDSELAEFTDPIYKDAFLTCEASDEKTWQTKKIHRADKTIPKSNGEIKIYDVIKIPIFEKDGKRKGIVVLGRDITERKRAEEELKKYRDHLEEMVKERTAELEAFSYSISHDLKAPLRAIDGFTRILMEDYVDKLDDEAKRIGSIIQQNSQKMGQLIDDLLEFSKLGRISMHFSNIDMKNMAIAIYNELTTSQQRDKITFSIDELPDIYGEPTMFRQVWMNLISNAIKFSSKKESPMISIKCEENETGFIYSISDNGAGFDTRYKDKLFGVFQRLHSEKEFPGTGVGLAIVQRIINRHNGKVWAESELGKGAIFYFSLPKRTKL